MPYSLTLVLTMMMILSLAALLAVSCAAFVDPIASCPKFPTREPPTSITDLRPQDVKVVSE